MKNRGSLGVVLVVFANLTALAAMGFAQGTSGKVEIKSDVIIVHPGTKLSAADATALDGVLQKYDKSLYKIVTYQNGQVTKTQGTLNDMQIDRTTSADLALAQSRGQSERAIQVIAPSAGPQKPVAMVPVNPQNNTLASPTASVSPRPSAPVPAGPQKPVPSGPLPAGPQTAPSSPVNPQMVGATTNPQQNVSNTIQTTEFIQQLTPILQKYSQ